jgi:hypothetical protein
MGNSGSPKPQKKNNPKSDSNPSTLLKKVMEEKGISFENIKSKLIQEDFPKAEALSTVEDISKTKTFELIGRLKKL